MAEHPVTVRNASRDCVLGERVQIARTFFSRGRGLMFVPELPSGEGLIIDPCTSIHTFFMRIPIDVLYMDRSNTVLRADAEVVPWRIGPIFTGSKWVIELPAGTIAATGTSRGDVISVQR